MSTISSSKSTFWLTASAILGASFIIGAFLISSLMLKAQMANRSVTVRGLSERDVTADLATWTLTFSATGGELQSVQKKSEDDAAKIKRFFEALGYDSTQLQTAGVGVNQYKDNYGKDVISIRRRISFRTRDIALAQRAVARQFDLIRSGVVLEEGSAMSYSFTGLDAIKPEMVAEATKDARRAAQQFAQDSGAQVGGIKSATQGYFSISARDGGGGGYGVSDTPNKKVRVVTTVNFYLK